MMIKVKTKNIIINIILIFLILLAAVSVFQGIKNAITFSTDFQYDSSKVFSMRINPYDETLEPNEIMTNPELAGLKDYYDRLEANQFPSMLILLLPFVIFPPNIANIVWVTSNILLTVLMLIMIKKLFLKSLDNRLFIGLCCLMLAGLGWRNNVGMGQHTVFAVAFFLLAVWLSERNKTVLSGLSLAVGFFKYTLTVPLAIYFVYKKKYKELFISIGIHIVLTLFSAWWLKENILNLIIKPLKISSWLGDEGYIDFGALGIKGIWSTVLCALVLLASFAFAIKLKNHKDISFNFFSILCYISLIVVYHRAYDFFILIIPVGIYLVDSINNKKMTFEFISSLIIFLYSNFVSKLIVVVISIIPSLSWITPVSKYVLAVMVYVFIAYLICKCFKIHKELNAKNSLLQGE